MAHDKPAAEACAYDLGSALAQEFQAVHGEALAASDEAAYRQRVAQIGQSALCLSGGGIRSAAFCLGVIQALARGGLLARFDYLSTVSGGGFIGSWLQALVREQRDPAAVQEMLREQEAAPPVSALRDFTNYLTPRPGLLSEDSWAGIVLYLRNLLINWFGFGAVFLLAVLMAIFYRTLLWTLGLAPETWVPTLAIAAGGLVLATWQAALDLPSHRPMRDGVGGLRIEYLSDSDVKRWIVLPMLVWAFCVPMALAHWLANSGDGKMPGGTALQFAVGETVLPLVYVAAMMVGYWGAASRRRAFTLYLNNFGGWLIATLASAGFIWIGLHLCGRLLGSDNQAEILAVIGPFWLILANVLQVTVHVALRREALLGDLDREWLARLSALKLRVVVIWALFAFCCLSLQRVAFHPAGAAWPFWAVPIVTFLSGPTAAWLGKRSGTCATGLSAQILAGRLPGWLLPAISVVFGIGLFTLLGELVGQSLGILQSLLPDDLNKVPWVLLVVQAVLAALLWLLIWHMMRRVDVNRFSMHGVYRNRLTRAFLGAARAHRGGDPFTGFDPDDNPRMADLAAPLGPRKLFPVINVALNLSVAARTAWAERKAAAFTVTPLACGSPILSRPGSSAGDPPGCYVATASYAGQERETGRVREQTGMTLATAMTISGAAVSPNWGYHSSPITAFLMTLFNLRLGAWLPNPAVITDAEELRRPRPRNAFAPMLDDLLGTTSDRAPAIYLSDGGHFDNLGLYEMVRRRCRLILVVDAGQDLGCNFADLGNAIRKVAIDQQIHIDLQAHARICPRGDKMKNPLDFATGTIRYPEGGEPGQLLYVKPCYLDDIPADVRAYGAAHPEFPHENTLEQWFTESQFESYRRLGEYQMGRLVGALTDGDVDIASLFRAARAKQSGPAPRPDTSPSDMACTAVHHSQGADTHGV